MQASPAPKTSRWKLPAIFVTRDDAPATWWNARAFGLSDAAMRDRERDWQSPLLGAYHGYVAGGGQEGIAVTLRVNGHAVCLLESAVMDTLDRLLEAPASQAINHSEKLVAWHEYGHCLYDALANAQGQRPPQSLGVATDDRYPVELFADAYALTSLWQHHRLDALNLLIDTRNRGLTLRGDTTHWTVPALTAWRDHLARGDDPRPEATLYHWVTTHDWLALRDAQLQERRQPH
ncbi:hypothetical protein DU506_00460 [Vreelandella rituensis]|uniref:Uncharacterized protein n=2 Tax=Vreelandella rituensis TaxID=2282306 RepID=A0A368U9S1_9GAMM|nr:hypothetical protein DU506_00460 [Halomonas rituensis]